MKDKYLTVTALTRYLKYKFDSDDNLRKVYIKGEISNFKAHTTGHLYFSIKDEGSIIKAIMFSSNASKLEFKPTEGMKVLISGSISIYEATGNYQMYVDSILEDGIGNLYIELTADVFYKNIKIIGASKNVKLSIQLGIEGALITRTV